MSIVQETITLRKELGTLAGKPEWSLLTRYDLLSKKPSRSLLDTSIRWIRRVSTDLGLAPPHISSYFWLPTLKHAPHQTETTTLLIWAIGFRSDELRHNCDGLLQRLDIETDMVPVLVTDVADFAYFSRLKWLVEYLPELSGENQSYFERKRRYLAWRYREAVIVPASAGRASEGEWEQILQMGKR